VYSAPWMALGSGSELTSLYSSYKETRALELAFCLSPRVAWSCDGAILVDLRPVRGLFTLDSVEMLELKRRGFSFAFGETAAQALGHLRFHQESFDAWPLDSLRILIWIGEITERDQAAVAVLRRSVDEWIRLLARLGLCSLGELLSIPERQMNRRFGGLRNRILDSLHAIWDRSLRLLPEPKSTRRQISFLDPETGLYPVGLEDLMMHLDLLGIWLEEYLLKRGVGVVRFVIELHFEVSSKKSETSRRIEIKLGKPLQRWIGLRRVVEARLARDIQMLEHPGAVTAAAFLLQRLELCKSEQLEFTSGTAKVSPGEAEQWFELFRQRSGETAVRTHRRRGRHLPEERLELVSLEDKERLPISAWEEGLMDLFHLQFQEETLRHLKPKPCSLDSAYHQYRVPLERLQTRWWTGGEVARDYYRIIDAKGVSLCVFLQHGVWYLSGSYD
jgi:hypothetical protein